MKSKLRFGNKLKTKDDVWSPTGVKDGNPKNKTGDEWCAAEEDGPVMLSCVKLWDPNALRVLFLTNNLLIFLIFNFLFSRFMTVLTNLTEMDCK